MSFYWPILLIIGSNVFYHLCAKSIPSGINPLASLSVTYLIGAVVSLLLYFVISPEKNLGLEFSKLNWAPLALGLAVVGLEVGSIYMYKAGWNISLGSLVSSISVSVILVFVGILLYKETITTIQFSGIALCIIGLILINK